MSIHDTPAARIAAAMLACACRSAPAALPDEIQVYTSDINRRGELGLELHVNTTPSGRSTPEFPGEIVPDHGWRVTPEFSYGVTPALEAGLYLPFAHGVGGRDRFAGPKVRMKWMPLRVDEQGNGAFAGLNFEYAWVSPVLEQATRALEVRPIVGWRDADWLVAVNPILGFDFAGPEQGVEPGLQPLAQGGAKGGRGRRAGRRILRGAGSGERLRRARRAIPLALPRDRRGPRAVGVQFRRRARAERRHGPLDREGHLRHSLLGLTIARWRPS